jgi:O-antigen/teichoic acid export membrane protein
LPPGIDSPLEMQGAERPFWSNLGWRQRVRRVAFLSWIGSLLAMATGIAMARLLGVADYGQAILALSITGFLAMLLDLTLDEAVAYYGTRSLVASEPGQLRELLNTALLIDALVGLSIGLIMVLSAPLLSRLVTESEGLSPLIRAGALVTIVATLNGTSAGALYIANRPDIVVGAQAMTALLRLILVIAGAWIGGALWAILAMALAQLIGSALQGLLAWRHVWQHLPPIRKRFGFITWGRRLASFGIRSSLNTTIASLMGNFVPILLGRLSGSREVGLFAVARLPLTVSSVATAPLRQLLLPDQVWLSASRARKPLADMIKAYTLWGLVIGVPAAVAGWFLLPWIIGVLYSQDFVSAVPAARILLLPGLLWLVFGWAKTLPAALGRPGIQTRLLALGSIATLGTVLALGGGAEEAAVGLALGQVLMAGGWTWLALKLPMNVEASRKPE